MGAAGPALKIGSQVASAASSGKGGGNQGGGISPQQAALAQYQAGQQELKSNFGFGLSGTGMSTMSTMENAGANLGEAMAAAGESDQNTANQNAINQAEQSGSLNQLANSAFSQGASQGNFGSSTGNFGASTGTGDAGTTITNSNLA